MPTAKRRYVGLAAASGRTLFDRDSPPGAEPEEIMAIKLPAVIIPGDDPAHAISGVVSLKTYVRAHKLGSTFARNQI